MTYLMLKDIAAAYDLGELKDYDPLQRIGDPMRHTVHLYEAAFSFPFLQTVEQRKDMVVRPLDLHKGVAQ